MACYSIFVLLLQWFPLFIYGLKHLQQLVTATASSRTYTVSRNCLLTDPRLAGFRDSCDTLQLPRGKTNRSGRIRNGDSTLSLA